MDSVAHTITGLAIRDSSTSRLRGSKVFLWTALVAANLPDLDIVTWLFGTDIYLAVHRGLSHSVFLVPFLAAACATAAYFISGRKLPYPAAWGWLCLVLYGHLAVDWITSYGTRLLAPFSNSNFSANLFPIVDPWFILITAALLAVGRVKKKIRRFGIIALASLIIYGGARCIFKYQSEAMVRSRYPGAEEIYSYANIESFGVWLNPSMYRVVARSADSAWSYEAAPISGEIRFQGGYDILDSSDPRWGKISDYKLSRDYAARSNLPILVRKGEHLYLSDLRYSAEVGKLGGLTIRFPLSGGEISGPPVLVKPSIIGRFHGD